MKIPVFALFCFAFFAQAASHKPPRAKKRLSCRKAFHSQYYSNALKTIKATTNPADKQTALNILRQEAKKNPFAMTRLGELYMEGIFIPQNQERGASLLIKAGKQGVRDAINQLGLALSEGKLDSQHEGPVISLLTRFAKKEHLKSIDYLGIWLLKQEALSPGAEKARALLEEKAGEKNFIAQYYFGQWLMRGESAEDKRRAFQLLKQPALNSHFDSINFLGQSLLDGHLTHPQDKKETIDILAEFASRGHYQAVFQLGLWLLSEKTFFKDITRELSLVEKSAGEGRIFSIDHLGQLLFEGDLLPQDIERGLNLLIKSADRGIYNSLNYLGEKLYNGQLPGLQNKKRVIGVLTHSGKKGDSYSTHWLGKYLLTESLSNEEAQIIISYMESEASSGNISAKSYLDKWREKNPGDFAPERARAFP